MHLLQCIQAIMVPWSLVRNNVILKYSVKLLEATFYHARSSYKIISNDNNDLLTNAHVLLFLLVFLLKCSFSINYESRLIVLGGVSIFDFSAHYLRRRRPFLFLHYFRYYSFLSPFFNIDIRKSMSSKRFMTTITSA